MALFRRKRGTQESLLGKRKPEYKKPQGRGLGTKKRIIALVAIIVVAIALYAYFVLQVNQTVINSPESVNITSGGGLYSINSNQYYISLARVSLSTRRLTYT